MSAIVNILGNVIISLAASAFFWLFSFVITRAKIIFSDTIEKTCHSNGESSYRVRLTNYGIRDFTEVFMTTRILIYVTQERSRSTYLITGDDQTIPIMPGWKRRLKEKARYQYYTYFPGFYMGEKAYKEYQNIAYPEYIRRKAAKKTLTISDLFNEYGERIELTVFIFGNDAVTGARKMFTSKKYTLKDVKDGKFSQWQKENHFSLPFYGKKHVESLLSTMEN